MVRFLSASFAVLLISCAGNPGVDLDVLLQTDLIAGADFDTILVRIDGQDPQTTLAGEGQFFSTPGQAASYTGIPTGERRVEVALLLAGAEVVSQEVVRVINASTSVTVIITRDCLGVRCEGGTSACLNGECVNPRCDPATRESCPDPQCTTAEDCPAAAQSCSERSCVAGVCLDSDDGSCGAARYCDPRSGCTSFSPLTDGGVDASDAGTDMGRMDAGPVACSPGCDGFQICEAGMCVTAPDCLTVDECGDGLICRNRRCVPPDHDVDGDGVPASEDCNELRADAYPGAPEICNLLDEDCDEMMDEGIPGVLCAEEGGECIAGACGCPAGQLDLDGVPETGCECAITPALDGGGAACGSAVDLGEVVDTGQMMMVAANVLPAGREFWYRVRGADRSDATCDNYHFRVRFVENPDDAFRFEVMRGACGASGCAGDSGFTDYNFATDFRNAAGIGECPCVRAPGSPGRNVCTDNSANYFIRVFRKPGAAETCAPFGLEISNGLFDS